ncbi:MAG: MFS transporter [Methanococcaceae archaeon]
MTLPDKLFNKNFYLLWQGQFISMIGTQVFAIAMIFWIKHNTNSASILGLLLTISSITSVLLTVLGGIIADRFNRRRIIIICDILSAFVLILLAFLFLISPGSKEIILPGIFISTVLVAALNAFFEPTISASIPDIVPKNKINGANSMVQLSQQFSIMLGQGLGGIFLKIIGTEFLIILNSISYSVAAFSEYFIKIPQKIAKNQNSWKNQIKKIKQDLMEGLSFINNNSGLKKIILMSTFLNFFTMPIIMLLPFYVEDFLKESAAWYGFILAFYSIGSLIGYLIASLLRVGKKMQGRTILLFMLFEPAGYILLTVISSGYSALVLAIIAGLMRGYVTVNIISILQLTTPSQIRGRVIGVLTTISGALAPLGAGLAGILFDLTGHNIVLIYAGCGVMMILMTIYFSMNQDFRKYIEIDITQTENEFAMDENVIL